MGIMRADVKAVYIENEGFHVDCVPKEKWDDLTEENFLIKDEQLQNDYFDFCVVCGKIL